MTAEREALLVKTTMTRRATKKMTKKMKDVLEERLAAEKNECTIFCQELAEAKDKGQEIDQYQAVLEQQFDAKIGAAQMAVNDAIIIYPEKQKKVVAIGSQVIICDASGHETKLIIDGANHKIGSTQIIDYISPVGNQLLGKKVGHKVMAGKNEMMIKEIDYPW